jgi:hypothetical protein
LDVGDVEGLAGLVEAGEDAVFGEGVFELEVGSVEEVAEGVFVLVAVEAAEGGAAGLFGAGLVVGGEGVGDGGEEGVALGFG